MSHFIATILACLFTPLILSAQINKPSLSPRTIVDYKVGIASIKLDYGQPSAKGRTIFGQLIPYDRLWRTGANSSTKITIDRTIQLSGQIIPKGTYALYTIPTEQDWTIIIHKNSTLWGSANYKEEEDFIRFKVPSIFIKDKVETLRIYAEAFNANGGDLVIAWENTKVVLPIFIDSDANIFQEIEEKILQAKGDISAQTYFDAAQFYYHKHKDLPQAVEWFDKAIKMRPNAFWYVYYRAELAYTIGDLETAKSYTENCLKQAKSNTASDFGYIAKCTLLLDKIAAKN